MIGATYPYCAVVFQLLAAQCNPVMIKFLDVLDGSPLIPISLIHAHDFASLVTDAIIRKEVRRVGKNHVKHEIELGQQFETIAMQ